MEKCCGSDYSQVLLLPCAGASNLGQLTNEVALRLREAGKGAVSCTAGIGVGIAPLVAGAKQARYVVAIDGCPQSCAKRCAEAAGLKPSVHLVLVIELAIPKSYDRPKEEDVRRSLALVERRLEEAMAASPG